MGHSNLHDFVIPGTRIVCGSSQAVRAQAREAREQSRETVFRIRTRLEQLRTLRAGHSASDHPLSTIGRGPSRVGGIKRSKSPHGSSRVPICSA